MLFYRIVYSSILHKNIILGNGKISFIAFLPQYKKLFIRFFPNKKISVGVVSSRDRIRDSTRDLFRNSSRTSFRKFFRHFFLLIRPQTPSETFAKIITQIPKGFFFRKILQRFVRQVSSRVNLRNFIQGLLKFPNEFFFILDGWNPPGLVSEIRPRTPLENPFEIRSQNLLFFRKSFKNSFKNFFRHSYKNFWKDFPRNSFMDSLK